MPPDSKCIDSLDFFKTSWAIEDECELKTDEALPNMGVRAPQAFAALGLVLAYIDSAASCAWGCPGGDHAMERLVFRSGNRARGAIRLLRLGFYDESLMLSRANGETANLLWLFVKRAAAITEWKAGAKWTASPAEVRRALEQDADGILPIDRERYKLLSGIGAHSDAGFTPAAHNVLGMPITPGTLQPEGVILCLNEVAHPISYIAIATVHHIKLPTDIKAATLQAVKTLFLAIGSFDIKSQGNYFDEQRRALGKALQQATME